MGYIEDYFSKGPEEVNPGDIDDFVNRRLEECITLDYKAIPVFTDPEKLSQHISAFANAEGGLLILGVSEKKQELDGGKVAIYPDQVTWGDPSLSKEDLENRLLSKVRPKVEGLRIQPIRKSVEDLKVIFLIDIPKSDNPPHMAADNRYYQRLNFRKVPMEHYQVADMFGRRLSPDLRLISKWGIQKSGSGPLGRRFMFKIEFCIKNVGKQMARFPCLTIGKLSGYETHPSLGYGNNKDFPQTSKSGSEWERRYAGGFNTVIYQDDNISVVDLNIEFYENEKEFPDLRINIGLFAENFLGRQEKVIIPGNEIKEKFNEALKHL